jgi:asparagine synthase (glutamine-hydrolysing)
MQSQSSDPIKTFTVGYEEAGYNEAVHAKAVAQHLGTDHTELYITSAEASGMIPQLANIYDEPFSDSSQIPTYLISKLARKYVTVFSFWRWCRRIILRLQSLCFYRKCLEMGFQSFQ